MQNFKAFGLSLVIITILSFVGCGGGGENKDNHTETSSNNIFSRGSITDLNIDNLTYKINGKQIRTIKNSTFLYKKGDLIEFYVNNIKLGETEAKERIKLFDVISEEDIFSDKLLNTLILLKTFDNDHNLNNGVVINDNIQNTQPRSFKLYQKQKTCSIDHNKVFIGLKADIFKKNLDEELKKCNMNISEVKFYNPKAKCKDIYDNFDSRVKIKTCQDYERAFWLNRYANHLLKIARPLRQGYLEAFNDSQTKVNNMVFALDGLSDNIQGMLAVSTDPKDAIFKYVSSIIKIASAFNTNNDEKEWIKKLLTIAEIFNKSEKKDLETLKDIMLSFGITIDNSNALETFYETLKDMEKTGNNKVLYAITEATIIYTIQNNPTINNWNDQSDGIFKDTINLLFSVGKAYAICRSRTDFQSCIKTSIFDTTKYASSIVWKSTAAVLTHYWWSDNIELADKLEQEAYWIKYISKINFNKNIYKEDLKKYWYDNPISWENFCSDLVPFCKTDAIDKVIEESLGVDINIWNGYKQEEISDINSKLFNIINASKGILIISKNKNKIVINYYNIMNYGNDEQNKITCKFNDTNIISDNIIGTNYNKSILLSSLGEGAGKFSCVVTIGNLDAKRKTIDITQKDEVLGDKKIVINSISPKNIKANRSKHGARIVLYGENFNKNCKVHFATKYSQGVFTSSTYISDKKMVFYIKTGNNSKIWDIWVEDEKNKSNKLQLYVDTSVNNVCMPNTLLSKSCNIENGIGSIIYKCTNDGNSWGKYTNCKVSSCNNRYHIKDNTCVKDDIQSHITLNTPTTICKNNKPEISLSWNKISNVVKYILHSNRVFSNGLYDKEIDKSQNTITLNDNLKSNDQYQIYIKAILNNGDSVKSNQVIVKTGNCDNSLQTGNEPDKPTSLTPGSRNEPYPTLTNTDVTLKWKNVDNATYYKVTLFDLNVISKILDDNIIENNIFDASNHLKKGHKYYWEVKACNDNGCSYAKRAYFNIKGEVVAPNKPTGLTPGRKKGNSQEIVDTTTITLSWDKVDNAQYYKIHMNKGSTGHSGVIVIRGAKTENNFYTINGLDKGQGYSWYVEACNEDKCSYSDFYGFKIKNDIVVPTPQNVSVTISENGSGTNAVITWDLISNAEKYKIKLYDETGNDDRSEYTDDNYIIFKNLQRGHNYKVKLRAYINEKNGDYSEYKYFTIKNQSQGSCPLNNFTNNKIVEYLKWGDKDKNKGGTKTQVKELQNFLNDLGYDAGTADGIFGDKTYYAIKAYQRDHGLGDDGIVGQNTRNKINNTSCN